MSGGGGVHACMCMSGGGGVCVCVCVKLVHELIRLYMCVCVRLVVCVCVRLYSHFYFHKIFIRQSVSAINVMISDVSVQLSASVLY